MLLHRLVRRAGASLIQKANISAEVNYTPIKRVPKCPEGFLHNSNPLVDGKMLIRNLPSKTGRKLDYVIAAPKDRDLIATFSCENFPALNSCCAHTKMTYEEFECMAAPGTDLMLEKGVIFCAYDGDKLVGALYNSFNYEDKFEQMFHGEMPGMKNPKFIVKDDYAEDVKKYPFAPSMNYYMTLMDIVQPQTGKFLPAGIKAFGILELGIVHKDYQQDGIFPVFFDLAEKAFKEKGIHHVGGYCVATGTRRVLTRGGYKSLYTIPYTDFKVNGKPVYSNLKDGATCTDTMIRTIK
uniref:N-acetyltransferase domain-containing protein n=1 Tax=Panagrellus redivivus TaxID=6233 RepID=A0A7E4W290_PANRE